MNYENTVIQTMKLGTLIDLELKFHEKRVKGQQYVATARRWVRWNTRRGLKILRTAVRRKVLVERK